MQMNQKTNMKKLLITLGIVGGLIGGILILLPNPVSPVGATVTTILGSDKLKDSRTTINDNFTNLNNDKIEVSTTTLPLITTLLGLTDVGTLTTGTWNADTLTVAYGGTGSTTLSQYQVLLGNGTSQLNVVSGLGTSGQSLVSNGAGADPTWQTVSFDESANFNVTGNWNFTGTNVLFKNFSASSTVANPLTLNGLSFNTPSSRAASSTLLMEDGSGNLTWNVPIPVKYTLANTADLTASGESVTTWATSTALTIPANTMVASSTINVHGSISCQETGADGGTCFVHLRDSTGANFGECRITATNSTTKIGQYIITAVNESSASSQTTICTGIHGTTGGTALSFFASNENTSTIDTSSALTLYIVAEGDEAIAIINNFVMTVNR